MLVKMNIPQGWIFKHLRVYESSERKGSRDLATFLHGQLSAAEATQDPGEVDLSDGPGASPLTPLLGKDPQEPREPGASKEQSRERCSRTPSPQLPRQPP